MCNVGAVKIYNATSSLVRFKKIFSLKNALVFYNAGVAVEKAGLALR
jgi:hypothetical protein